MQHFAKTQAHTLFDLARLPFCCTSSMFINRASVDKYARLLTGQWRLGMPIDMYLRDLVHKGQLKAFLTVPFMTTVSSESVSSDINSKVTRSQHICTLYRQSFFQEADLSAIAAEMKQLTAGCTTAKLAEIYLDAERYTLSNEFQRF
jgi:hypothetical protein